MEGHHPAVEQYLETILELEEAGIVPMRARIVERLGVSAPAVSETVKRLEREGYVTPRQRPGAAPVRGRPGVRDVDAAHAPARRGAARRRAQGAVAAGARGGLPARARHQRQPRAAPRRRCSATRAPARTAARSPGSANVVETGPLHEAVERAGRRVVRRAAHRRAPADARRTRMVELETAAAAARPGGRRRRRRGRPAARCRSTASTCGSTASSPPRSTSASDAAGSTAQPGPHDPLDLGRARPPAVRPSRRRTAKPWSAPAHDVHLDARRRCAGRRRRRARPARPGGAPAAARSSSAAGAVRPARRREREGQRQHAGRRRAAVGGAAGDPGPGAAPAEHAAGRRRRRRGHDGEPGARRAGPAPRRPGGPRTRHGCSTRTTCRPSAQRGVPRGEQVGRVDAAAGAVPQHQRGRVRGAPPGPRAPSRPGSEIDQLRVAGHCRAG